MREEDPTTPRRPVSVTILALVVLIFAVINLVRLTQTLKLWDFLSQMVLVPPIFLALSGLVWGGVGLVLTWGLWRGLPWGARFTRLAALIYALYYWLDRILLNYYPSRNANWPFAAGATLFILAWIVWVLSRSKTKQFFGETETHER